MSSSRLDAIASVTPKQLTGAARHDFDAFLTAYFATIPDSETADIADDNLNGGAFAHWRLARERQPGDTALLVINPRFEQHGWDSDNTVLLLATDDQPWLLASLRHCVISAGHAIHRVFHPILVVGDKSWQALDAATTLPDNSAHTDSLIRIDLDRCLDEELDSLRAEISAMLDKLNAVRADGERMTQRLTTLRAHLKDQPQAGNRSNADYTADFIDWLNAHNFACLGLNRWRLIDGVPEAVEDETLGLCREAVEPVEQIDHLLTSLLKSPDKPVEPAIIGKAGGISPVIRAEPLELLLLPLKSKTHAWELFSIVGMFVPSLGNQAIETIPWLQQRVEQMTDAMAAAPDSHDGKAILQTVRDFPRDMLTQMNTDNVLDVASTIVSLHERQQIRLFHSLDPFGRFCNCLVYIPRDAYHRELRLEIESILRNHLQGQRVEFNIQFSSDSSLARLHFVVQRRIADNSTNTSGEWAIDWPTIEERIATAAISWEDRLHHVLHKQYDGISALRLIRLYGRAFPSAYKEDYAASAAVADIEFIESRLHDAPIMSFYRHILSDTGTINFKLFARNEPVSLSTVMPVIENLGLHVTAEHPFEVRRGDRHSVWIHEFTVQHENSEAATDDTAAARVQAAFSKIWQGDAENDGFNRLILDAELDWRQVAILRSLCKYLLQVDVPFSQTYMIDTLVANAPIARDLVSLFEERFNPASQATDTAGAESTSPEARIKHALDEVQSLDEDRILRNYLALILAIVRTNVFCTSEASAHRPYFSYKIDSAKVPDLPLPRPLVEIFVYSPAVEGIHLRGGRVARGGLRWSDRREDFRTEVLGLMKAQMVKNTVIVPVGSKGGFYVKAPLSEDRDTAMQTVIECYKTFLRGLLDITDNIVGASIQPPAQVVRHDDDDPYLVVAADKGTATFSDFANDVSIEYGFWLGDAFASGGSAGYDHKKMGITARGAWESVKRHFRERGHDTQSQPFTVVGVGDMSGDVFGNGMLLSEHIQLVAAFNHLHIFIDPTPDSEKSYQERTRLFALPRSTWEDYNTDLLSTGGKIISRKEKRVTLNDNMRVALGTDVESCTPDELVRIILTAPVDLLWNGGIGTYIKAAGETHADAADRANDHVRVNGEDVRAAVIGEGGNLGVTQCGRIAFAAHGGHIYTDAIDNSAGVDCSDHEVNIKILLNALVAHQDLTLKQRDQLLVDMTADVSALVLKDNYVQTQCISLTRADGCRALDEQARYISHLENAGLLDRQIEFLPDNAEIADRLASDHGLTTPEVAVVVAYSKMVMYKDLLATEFANDPALRGLLVNYFPERLQTSHPDAIGEHRLGAEIICTLVINELVNRVGPTFVFRLQQELGADLDDVARAFVAVSRIFQLDNLWLEIEATDNVVNTSVQYQMLILVRGLVERATQWLVRTRRASLDIDTLVERYASNMEDLFGAMPGCLAEDNVKTFESRQQFFVDAGVDAGTASRVARVVPLSSALDIVDIARTLEKPVADVATVYFNLGHHLDLQWLREQIGALHVTTHWHALARAELRSDLHYQQRHIAAEVMRLESTDLPPAERVDSWAKKHTVAVAQYSDRLVDIKASTAVDFAMLSLAVNEVHKLLQSDRPLSAN